MSNKKESTDSPKKAKQATIAFTKVEIKAEENNSDPSENKEESNKKEKLNGDAAVKEEVKEESITQKEEEATPKKENVEKPKTEKKELTLKAAGQGQKGADYNPAKRNYHPIDDAFWERRLATF